jgi:putative acyl-CoA dehydrogenase
MNVQIEDSRPVGEAPPADQVATHRVLNQAKPCVGYNAYTADVVLKEQVTRHAPWSAEIAAAVGTLAGDEQTQDIARLANEYGPQLRSHDRFGNRTDWVEFHPAWHQLMGLAFGNGVHSLAWTAPGPAGHFARAVLSYLWNQVENGVGCPTGMAYAACAGFEGKPEFATWREKTLSTQYDSRRLPIEKKPAPSSAMR